MGLFSKKFDREKDCLRLEFDLENKQYVFYLYKDLVSYDSLNRKTKKYLDKQNNELNNNIELLEQKIKHAEINLRREKLKKLGYTCDSFEVLLTENKGTMSKKMEDYLNKLISEENILLGIHRVGNISQDIIEDILINGLIITGHLGGATNNVKELHNNVSYYPDNTTIIKELMYANVYKNSTGSILIRIPDEDLAKNIFITDGDGITRLNPKYILGYVPLEENHHIETIIRPEDIVKSKENVDSSNLDFEVLYNQFYPNQEIVEESHKTR